MKISALNRKLRKAFGGRVTAVLADGCIVLRGALDRWDDVVRAGQMAATKYSTCHVVNDITFTGGEDAPMRVPTLRDDALDGQTPDVLIIGGGISGVSIARELTRQKLDILVVDKECDLALGASGRNDGEVHPGIDLGRGSVKHKYIRRGNAMYDQICKELDVPFSRVGQYVCFQHGWLRRPCGATACGASITTASPIPSSSPAGSCCAASRISTKRPALPSPIRTPAASAPTG